MREIVLDTETTGFDPESGDRIVEIGCLELVDYLPTGQTFHVYIHPERNMPREAFNVHGIGPDLLEPPQDPLPGQVLLTGKPLFKDIAQQFLGFIQDSKLVIHNAPFDMKFLNAELTKVNLPLIPYSRAIDTLDMTRRKFPGSPASLDALCGRFGIDNSSRTLHGALLDSEILAEVYLELIGGKQQKLNLTPVEVKTDEQDTNWRPTQRPRALPSRLTEQDVKAHEDFVSGFKAKPLWHEFNEV